MRRTYLTAVLAASLVLQQTNAAQLQAAEGNNSRPKTLVCSANYAVVIPGPLRGTALEREHDAATAFLESANAKSVRAPEDPVATCMVAAAYARFGVSWSDRDDKHKAVFALMIASTRLAYLAQEHPENVHVREALSWITDQRDRQRGK